jgi:methionyl aminopeptidase
MSHRDVSQDAPKGPASSSRQSADPSRTRVASERVATQTEESIVIESRRICPTISEILGIVGHELAAGITTDDVTARLVEESLARGLEPAMLGYNGFPAAAAISVNDELVHGVPSRRRLRTSDLVKIEFGVASGTAFASQSWTFPVGEPSEVDRQLIDVCTQALRSAISTISPKHRVGDIGSTIQATAEAAGLSVVRSFVGYGMGKQRIQAPQVPGVGHAGEGARLRRGSILNLHVLLKRGTPEVRIVENRWTAVAEDGERGALCTSMVRVTDDGHELLTALL